MATGTTAAQKATSLRIQRALAKPRAIGMKGFLLWTEAAWPKPIAQKILAAAAKYTPGATPGGFGPTLASPQSGGLGAFGDTASDLSALTGVTVDLSAVNPDGTQSGIYSTDPTVPPVSATTAATPATPASASWMSDIGAAVSGATTAFLGVTQVNDAQKIFNTNLARAQQGLSMIPVNPTQYGLPAPTANIGLTGGAQSTILIVGGVLAIGLVIAALAKGK